MTIAGEGLTQPTLLAVSCGEETFLWLQQGQRDGDSSTAPWAFRSEWHFVRRLAFGADHLGFLPPLRLVAASSDCVRIHDLDEDVCVEAPASPSRCLAVTAAARAFCTAHAAHAQVWAADTPGRVRAVGSLPCAATALRIVGEPLTVLAWDQSNQRLTAARFGSETAASGVQ